ncbi:MAG: DUF814 domain-containing protein [Bacteroidetes bacterium]|nr:MAG: DUF814 domain-containing protein [Bacteroidota bacterium]
MLSTYFVFRAVAAELHARYAGAVIAAVYSQEKDTLAFTLYTPEPHTLVVSCAGRENAVTARPGDHRARTNSVDLFPALVHDRITAVTMDPADRTLYASLASGAVLCIDMFGSKANVTAVGPDGTVTDAFAGRQRHIGTARPLRLPPPPPLSETFVPAEEEFRRRLLSSEKGALAALKAAAPKLGAVLCRETLHRAGIAENAAPLGDTDAASLRAAAMELVTLLLGPADRFEPCLYYDGTAPEVLSLVPLRHCADLRCDTYPDVLTAVQRFIGADRSAGAFRERKKELLHWLLNELSRSERTVAAVEKERTEASRDETYERYGRLLMAHLPSLRKGLRSVELDDTIAGGTAVIPLDPALPPVRNAEAYFDKAKRARSAREESLRRLETVQRRRGELAALRSALEEASDGIALREFHRTHAETIKRLGYMTEKEQDELPPFKIFTVDGGFTVYAGKSSENNDLLTVKWAKPNDLWFHARGSSGSHVVLKTGTGSGQPSRKAVEQAAAIAAYYSKMRNAKSVPVAMTEKKYVRKPRGVPAGTVVIEREKVIFVAPSLPQSEE